MKVSNDLVVALDSQQRCTALFSDLSKAFDTVDRRLLLQMQSDMCMSIKAIGWFEDSFTNRSQYVQADGMTTVKLPVCTLVPQVSILGPLLFTVFLNVKVYLFADDTMLYSSAASLEDARCKLQSALNIIQEKCRVNDIWTIS